MSIRCVQAGDTVLPVNGEELAQAGQRAGLDPDGHFDRGALVFQLTACLCRREVKGCWPGCGLIEQLN